MRQDFFAIGIRTYLVSAILAFGGCSTVDPGQPGSEGTSGHPAQLREIATDLAGPAATNQLYSAEWRDGKVLRSSVSSAPPPIVVTGLAFEPKADLALVPAAPAPKIDELLEAHLRSAEAAKIAGQRVQVIVTYQETLKLPRFPLLNIREPRSSTGNQAMLQRADQLVGQIAQARATEHAAHASRLVANYGAQIKETFWLINGMVVDLPLDQVRALAAEPDVQFVEHAEKPIPPPANNSVDVRNLLNTEPYAALNETTGFIGILDTGIRLTHTLLSRVDLRADCVNGTSNNCFSGSGLNPADDFWNHGTSTASELTANSNLGDANRGVTAITVDSWKIYNSAGLVTAAAVRGFQASVALLDRVIVAEIQDTGGDTGAISTAADQAFDAGAVVVAAAGNFGCGAGNVGIPGSVRAPGNARKALGVGAVDVTSLALECYSGRGPTSDGRVKPDILGPTNVNAASNVSDTALQLFTGTSAATPNAAGATALMWEFFGQAAPGFINSVMINSGRNLASSAAFDNSNGAGLPFLPVNGTIFSSSVIVSSGGTVDVPIDVTGNIQFIDSALWWPESPGLHNDVDLQLVNPNGVVVASSVSSASIFEKARATTGLVDGTWKIRIHAFNVTGSQLVFWAWFQQS